MTCRAVPIRILIAAALLVVLLPGAAFAYVGPGAGFALAGSIMAVFGAMISALSMLLFWPIRRLIRLVFRRRPPEKPRFHRVVVLGLDGLDYHLAEQFLAEGRLPNLAALSNQGDFKRLSSTLPPISPVAWSSFQTGTNPGKHNIFDFLVPDEQTYKPKLSSAEIRTASRTFGWGPLRWTRKAAEVRLLRKSRPFWSFLSDYGIFNCILRVPVTFPPEKLHGVQLSAMCTPDLRGTQGTFSLYTTQRSEHSERIGGEVHCVERRGNSVTGELLGPAHPSKPLSGPLKIQFTVDFTDNECPQLRLNGECHRLTRGEYSDWIHVTFQAGFGRRIRGICRFLLQETEPAFLLYVTPVNIDPESPAMPIGYPAVFPMYLAKQQGPYATLGLAEDTWGVSEHAIKDRHFLRQCLEIERERESMFFDALEKVPKGLCVCVFDGTDRMQHLFWRYLDRDHPARPREVPPELESAIEEAYERIDKLVGRTMAHCRRDGSLLLVISDHGFNAFRRGIDLNRWLEESGYLSVDNQRRNEEHFGGVDWSRTRAFAIGLTGIYINEKGRFGQGIVEPGEEASRLRDEIASRLASLTDPADGRVAIRRVYQAAKVYRGPYKDHAPDLIVGYDRGFRVSWDTAVGRTASYVFHDNKRAWSGDHCVDPSVVPGVLFCNRKIHCDQPRLFDLGPTILKQFGVPVPDHMDGQALDITQTSAYPPASRNPAMYAAVVSNAASSPEVPCCIAAGQSVSEP
jgi:predicted AlkP superfamily phosphohydrolase/phosphomutase